MMISEFLSEAPIKIGLEARNKTAAIEEMIDLLVSDHQISLANRGSVIEAVMKREQMISTGMEHGVAIPHGAVDSVDDIVAAMGVSRDGIDFQSIDGRPTYIVILLILPSNKYSSSVQAMAGISRVLTSPQIRKSIIEATSSDALLDCILEEEERLLLSRE
ncbi:MAG: PTS sugar transporter subunit IIA [Lentisphaerae bacterium]|nr:PTS sugar transporter subunit IIA [Lentisphaerota bacterium]